MNLSDLVHRTAGDNKVAATTNNSNNANSKLSLFSNGSHNTNLFQQTIIDSAASPSNLFNNFSRQDQQLLFSMPNTDWMNNNMFFNNNLINNNDALIEPMTENNSNSNDNNNAFFLKQDLNNMIQSSPLSSVLTPEQKLYQQTTAFANQNIFRDFNISLANATLSKSPSTPLTNGDVHNITTENNETVETEFNLYNSNTTNNNNTTEPKPPLTTTVVETRPIMDNRLQTAVKVTGDNVTASNIEDGYIQFVLRHDPTFVSDGIESLVFAKRKFQNVPKTGDITYTTWDIYQLVLKLHRKEIKNWSQLVGRLGLEDMVGRPQFAQRVKRWMHRLKIDSYFDYLLGNAYDFNGPPSTCLNIGNYKKRSKSDTKNDHPHHDSPSEGDEEPMEEDENDHRIPILLAGSRKRMRDSSQNSIQMIENAQKYLQLKQEEEEGEESESSERKGDEEMEEEESSEHEEEVEEVVEEEEVDEEDELASSSSSPISPTRIVIPSPPPPPPLLPVISPKQRIIEPPPLAPKTPPSVEKKKNSPLVPPVTFCSNCSQQTKKMNEMEKEVAQLKLYITKLESQVEKQNIHMNKLIRERERTERWRKQIISDLARGPTIISDDEDDEDEEEDEGSTSDD